MGFNAKRSLLEAKLSSPFLRIYGALPRLLLKTGTNYQRKRGIKNREIRSLMLLVL